jgi:hypothetical protein
MRKRERIEGFFFLTHFFFSHSFLVFSLISRLLVRILSNGQMIGPHSGPHDKAAFGARG